MTEGHHLRRLRDKSLGRFYYELRIENPRVDGSIPPLATKLIIKIINELLKNPNSFFLLSKIFLDNARDNR